MTSNNITLYDQLSLRVVGCVTGLFGADISVCEGLMMLAARRVLEQMLDGVGNSRHGWGTMPDAGLWQGLEVVGFGRMGQGSAMRAGTCVNELDDVGGQENSYSREGDERKYHCCTSQTPFLFVAWARRH
jgi:hypothetical protein